ncbi:MAG: NERD domain-containing protein [Thiohalomonadales bacterium]
MDVELKQLTDLMDQYWPYVAALVAVGFLVLSGMVGHRLLNPGDNKIIDAQIKKFTKLCVKDVVIPDGIYGYHFINYVLLLPDKILLLGIQDYAGYIFGADNLDQWTQVLNNKSTRFENPIMIQSHCIQAMEPLVNTTEVIARVVFTSNSSFPKGKPSGVIEQHLLQQELELLATAPDLDLGELWQSLYKQFDAHKKAYKKG